MFGYEQNGYFTINKCYWCVLLYCSILAGNEVVIVKNGTRICGSGGVLCTAPIVQNKCYFEVKVQQSGKWNSCLDVSNCY